MHNTTDNSHNTHLLGLLFALLLWRGGAVGWYEVWCPLLAQLPGRRAIRGAATTTRMRTRGALRQTFHLEVLGRGQEVTGKRETVFRIRIQGSSGFGFGLKKGLKC